MNRIILNILSLALVIAFAGCSSDNSPEQDPEPQLMDVEVELLSFIYTPQNGNIPDRLQYEIRFTNPNQIGVIGFYRVTTNATFGSETLESTLLSTDESICYEIAANASCVFIFDETGDVNLGSPDNIEFVSATYNIDSTQ